MKKRTAGLSGILALSMIFVALVSACYNPDFEPGPITGVQLDKTVLELLYDPPRYWGEHVFTATLIPNNVGWDRVDVEWRTYPNEEAVVFFGSTREPNARVVAHSPGRTFVIVSVTVDGHTFEAACMVTVGEP